MLALAFAIPFLFFFFLVVSRDVVDGQLDFAFQARAPEIVRSLICLVPLLNLISLNRVPGDNPIVIWLAIGLLVAPFSVALYFSPTDNDAASMIRFLGKWAISKVEGLIYGSVLLLMAVGGLSVLEVAPDLPERALRFLIPAGSFEYNNVPTLPIMLVVAVGAAVRAAIVIRSFWDSHYRLVLAIATVATVLFGYGLWFVAVSQLSVVHEDWKLPVAGFGLGVMGAALSDLAFKRDLLRRRRLYGRW